MKILRVFLLLSWCALSSALPVHSLESADDYMKLGNDAFQKGEYDLAIQNYTLALGVNPNRIDIYLNRGSAYHNKGQFDQAIRNYNDAVNLDPNNLLSYQYRAASYFEKGEYHKTRREINTLQSMGGVPDPDFLQKLKEAEEGKKPESTGSSIDEAMPLAPEYQKSVPVAEPAALGAADSAVNADAAQNNDNLFGTNL
jgi:Tfp pilus assembly protein PilF